MKHEPRLFQLHEQDLAPVWDNNPIARATRCAALFAKVDEITTLRAVILEMHKAYEIQQQHLFEAMNKARSYDLMTEGIKTADGRKFVFRPPICD